MSPLDHQETLRVEGSLIGGERRSRYAGLPARMKKRPLTERKQSIFWRRPSGRGCTIVVLVDSFIGAVVYK
jgi:hypothetical protein